MHFRAGHPTGSLPVFSGSPFQAQPGASRQRGRFRGRSRLRGFRFRRFRFRGGRGRRIGLGLTLEYLHGGIHQLEPALNGLAHLAGDLDGQFVFSGLGSKGVTTSPWSAAQLAGHLVCGTDLPPDLLPAALWK